MSHFTFEVTRDGGVHCMSPIGFYYETYWCGSGREFKTFALLTATIYKTCIYTQIYFSKTLSFTEQMISLNHSEAEIYFEETHTRFIQSFKTPRDFVKRMAPDSVELCDTYDSIGHSVANPLVPCYTAVNEPTLSTTKQFSTVTNMVRTCIDCNPIGPMGLKVSFSTHEQHMLDNIYLTLKKAFPNIQQIKQVP